MIIKKVTLSEEEVREILCQHLNNNVLKERVVIEEMEIHSYDREGEWIILHLELADTSFPQQLQQGFGARPVPNSKLSSDKQQTGDAPSDPPVDDLPI